MFTILYLTKPFSKTVDILKENIQKATYRVKTKTGFYGERRAT